MGKILVWVGLGLVILLLVRLLGPAKRRSREGDDEAGGGSGPARDESRGGPDRSAPRELMMRCAVCSVHVPSSEALYAGGKVYCCAAHRDSDGGGE